MENLYGMTNILMIILLFCMVYDLLLGRSNNDSSDEVEFFDDDDEFIILSKAKEYTDNLFKLRVKVEIFDNGFEASKYNFSKELLSTDEYNNLNTVLMNIIEALEFTKVDESDCDNTDDMDLDCEDYFDYIIERTTKLVKYSEPLMVVIDDNLRYLEDVGYKLLFSESIEDSKKLMIECIDRMSQLSESLKCLEGEV